ncbi:MAG: hypothetical protein P1V36_14445 [Planctomycetota bacterium]|nr:hypothetical protein [Planctomycetota bacterium]
MVSIRVRVFFVALALSFTLPLAGCGGDQGGEVDTKGPSGKAAAVAPVTKDAMVAHLQTVLKAILGKDWDAAAACFHFGPRAPGKEDWPEAFEGMIKKKELSEAGLAILAEKGTFGTLEAVFAERGASWAERAEVALERCYALGHDGAEVAVFASDDGLKIIRLDDVGKLR